MKKILAILIVVTLSVGVSVAFADSFLYEGEGYVAPTNLSQEPVTQRLLRSQQPAGENITAAVDAEAFPDIEVTFSAVDENGVSIGGITQDQVTVTEQSNLEGAPVTETLTCFRESSGSGDAVTVALVFDLSGSMGHGTRLEDAKEAANYFFANFSDADRGALVTFSSGGTEKIVIPSGLASRDTDGNGVSDIKEAIDDLSAGGFTAVYDGTAKGIESIRGDAFPKAVVVFSDGQTNSDRSNSINSVISEAQDAGVPLYTIGLGVDLNNMETLADSTGGKYYFSPTAQDMNAIYDEISRSIRNQYTVCYTSHNPAQDGTTRTVTVLYDNEQGTDTYQVESELAANFNWTPQVPAPGEAIQFTDQSSSPNGGITAYDWNFADLGSSAEADPVYTFSSEGTYPVTLTITDANGETSEITRSVPVSNLPTAAFSWSPVVPAPGADVQFTDQSTPTGDIAAYSWDFGTAGTSDAANPIVRFPAEGIYPVTLTVTDIYGLTNSTTQDVTVSNTPQAGFTWSPEPQNAGEPVMFTDASTPAAAPIVEWNWTFGDQGSSTEQNPAFAFASDGVHQVTLTVTDANGLSGSVTRGVTIQGCVGDCDANGGCFINTSSGKPMGGVTGVLFIGVLGLLGICLGLGGLARTRKWSWSCLVVALFTVTILFGSQQDAGAGVKAGKFTLSPMVGMYVFDEDQSIDKDFLVGLGLGYNFTDNFGAELMLNYGQFVHHYMDRTVCRCVEEDLDGFFPHIDLLYHFRPEERFVPYLAIGGGASMLDFDNLDKETSAAVNGGGGLKFFFTDNIAFRADVRGIYLFDDSYNNLSATAGLVFQFPAGERKRRTVPEPPPKPISEPPEREKQGKQPTTVIPPPVSEEEKQPKSATTPPEKEKTPPPVTPVTPPPEKEEKKVEPPVDTGVSIDLKILFDFDKSYIKPIYHNNIKYVADILKKYPNIAIEIEGHTCSIGTERYNLGLSRRRAESVKRYLVEKFGVSPSRMTTKSYGESRPAYDNSTKEGREKNRRVIVVKLVR